MDPGAERSLALNAGDQVPGRLVLWSAEERPLSGSDLEGAQLVAAVFASALARQRAEARANQMRDELAHCLRLSTVGELATSIAHELNQPLTAILANAQAAGRLLADDRDGARAELREMLEDIVSEDRRAGEVIRGVRLLLRKGERNAVDLDVDALVRDVLRLVANDAMIRDVDLSAELDLAGAFVRGDRVQLQQVLLNLLLNALEAIPDGPGPRTVTIRTAPGPGGTAIVSVTDTGRGLPAGTEAAVFEPFYTTKADGLGMGLSIARSIVEAHGGTISAAGSADGARVTFTLPLVGPPPS
jgi:two-component system sensor kinase FixL